MSKSTHTLSLLVALTLGVITGSHLGNDTPCPETTEMTRVVTKVTPVALAEPEAPNHVGGLWTGGRCTDSLTGTKCPSNWKELRACWSSRAEQRPENCDEMQTAALEEAKCSHPDWVNRRPASCQN